MIFVDRVHGEIFLISYKIGAKLLTRTELELLFKKKDYSITLDDVQQTTHSSSFLATR
jgi:hypothetical protein